MRFRHRVHLDVGMLAVECLVRTLDERLVEFDEPGQTSGDDEAEHQLFEKGLLHMCSLLKQLTGRREKQKAERRSAEGPESLKNAGS